MIKISPSNKNISNIRLALSDVNAIQCAFASIRRVLIIDFNMHTYVFDHISDSLFGTKFLLLFFQFVKVSITVNLWLFQLHKDTFGLNFLDLLKTFIAVLIFPLSTNELYKAVSIVAYVLSHSCNFELLFFLLIQSNVAFNSFNSVLTLSF